MYLKYLMKLKSYPLIELQIECILLQNQRKKNIKIIIAGAGGAAHLPGMIASLSNLPVLGVPVESKFLNGLDSLLSIVQMPYGVPTATFAVGKSGAKNAALFAIGILSINNKGLYKKLINWKKTRQKMSNINQHNVCIWKKSTLKRPWEL